jgi:DNA invertase Pin-like site-specific DNA recombinase
MTKTHGHIKWVNGKSVPSITYVSWQSMKYRCSKKAKDKPNYIGIEICKEWKNSFECFLKDMGERPSKAFSIDRKDGNKGYFKENCRWATKKEQAQNTKSNVFKGTSIEEYTKQLGVKKNTFGSRLKRGYSVEEALNPLKYKTGHDGLKTNGEQNVNSKLTEEDILRIRAIRESGASYQEIADLFNITKTNVGYIIRKQTWKHI